MSNEETLNENTKAEAEEQSVAEAAPEENGNGENAVASEAPAEAEKEQSEATEAETEEKAEAKADDKAVEKDEPVREAKKEKPQKQKKANGMSKLFKLIYYPVLSFVVLLMLVFSVIDGVFGYKPKAYDADYYKAVNAHIERLASSTRSGLTAAGASSSADYIATTLFNGGFTRVSERKAGDEDDGETVTTITDWSKSTGAPSATVTTMTSNLTGEIQKRTGATEYLVGTSITNVVAAIPSEKTKAGEESGAVIVTVRYDSRTDTVGATDNASFVATAIESLLRIVKDNKALSNDLVVVFTEDYGASFGANAFFAGFDGLGDVVSRATAGLSLDAYGNSGTLALTDVSAAGLDYINAFTKVSGNTFNSSVVPASMPDGLMTEGAVAAFADANIPAVQVAVVGGIDAAQSYLDSYDEVSQAILHQQAKFFDSFVSGFAGKDKSFKQDSGKEKVFFSYFDWGTIAYTSTAAYVLGAILIALIAGAIAVTAVKKTFSLTNMLKAVAVELLVVVGAAAAMFAAYFLIALMLTGFGAMPIHAIVQIRSFNAGVLIAAMLVALGASFGLTSLFKKLFKITSSDAVRGTALLFGLAGVVMSYACPAYSFLTVIPALLLTATLLCTACLNGKLKDQFGFGFDRLFIYAVPVAVCLPVVIAPIAMLMQLLPMYLLPATMSLFVGLIGVAVPYLDRTTAMLDKVAKKLPQRTLRIERTVTEKVEDRAKKGKFTERTVKRIDKEKVPLNYKNYFGITMVCLLAVVVALLSGGIGISFGKTVTDAHAYSDAVYNDALVYEWEYSGGSTSQKIVVDDLIAYKYFRYAVSDLEWDSENNRYSKTVGYNTGDIIPTTPELTRTGDSDNYLYNVTTFDGPRSNVIITVPNASLITKITVINVNDVEFVYEFDNAETIVLNLPYGFGNFSMRFEGANPSTIQYEEQRTVTVASPDNALANVDEWNSLLQYYRDSDIYGNIRGGIVLKRTASF